VITLKRPFLAAAVLCAVTMVLPGAAVGQASAGSGACPAAITPSQTEGPYFKAGSPERTSLAPSGTGGTPLLLQGKVYTRSCAPVPGATLDFWQADDAGRYDNAGYALRGHVKTDSTGAWSITTILPGIYPGRTRHIHVKVQVPGRPALTTQLYFPEEKQRNAQDGIYDAALLVTWIDAPKNSMARFDFVLDLP
jgi:protocatechuate 3,4-dioxygenase beta subunit